MRELETIEFFNGRFSGAPVDLSDSLDCEYFEDCEIVGNIHDRQR